MVSYKKLGLVNTKKMFAKAVKGGYAIPAFNFNTMEQMQAIIQAAVETKSPVIMQVSKGARKYANPTILRYMAEGAVQYAKELGCKKPQIVLHLDHGDSYETCKSCIDSGFSSVMIDGSSLPFKENIKLTKKVVNYAHKHDVTVEAELGVLAGVEDEVSAAESHYTKPEEVVEFATKTGCDSLAISIGTSHGAYKFKPEQCTRDKKTSRRRWRSTSSRRSKRSSPASRSCCTARARCRRTASTRSTSTAASFPMRSAFRKSSCARPRRARCARSTSTPTRAWR